MHPKQIVFGEEARQKLLSGVTTMARAVTTTLSPKGRNVALGQPFFNTPKVLHDGVSVAKEIILEDPFENMGALLAREAAERTNDEVGDGTTTAILLTHKITELGMRFVNNGANPMLMKNGIDRAVAEMTKAIKKIAQPLKHEDWLKVATISAQNELIGRKIVEALELVGENGMIEVQDGKSTEIVIEHKEGLTYDSGYLSPYFCKGPQDLTAEIKDAYVLLTDQYIKSFEDFMPLLEKFTKVSKDLVVIAEAVEEDALNGMIINKLQSRLNVLIVRAPYYGARRRAMMRDIAVVTGGKVVSEAMNMRLSDPNVIEYLGRAEMVRADKNTTSIIGGKGEAKAIEDHVAAVKAELAAASQPHEVEAAKIRLAKLTGGVALIQVGASSESEMKNLQERVIDAKGATQAAIRSGIVAGGGVTLIRAAAKCLPQMKGANPDEDNGIRLIHQVVYEPLLLLAKNAGKDPGAVMNEVMRQRNDTHGYNVLTDEYGDMLKMGIIEPAQLAIASLKYAASAASMILTTDCLVNDSPEVKKNG